MSNVEFPKVEILKKKNESVSENSYKVTYEYSWATFPNAETAKVVNLIPNDANSNDYNRCCRNGSFSFNSKMGGDRLEGSWFNLSSLRNLHDSKQMPSLPKENS